MRFRPFQLTGLAAVLALWPSGSDTAWAKAAAGRFVVDAGKGTVLDTLTKGTWQRAVVVVGGSDGQGNFTFDDAKAYCQNLQLAGSGWRLPNVVELSSIVDRQEIEPTIDKTVFPSTPAEFTWTATPYVAGGSSLGQAYGVKFDYGTAGSDTKTKLHRVRCLR